MTPAIENAPDRLDEMIADLAAYDGPLGPGPYWAENQKATLKWLRENDLNRYRVYERSGKALSNFGGGSRWRTPAEIEAEKAQLYNSLIYRLGQKLSIGPLTRYYSIRIRDLARERHGQNMIVDALVRILEEIDSGNELSKISIAPAGKPSDAFEIDGRLYTPKFVDEFFKYLDMKAFIDFPTVRTLVEIGPGAGTFAELMAKLDPELRLFLIDIPPQLYVTQQVLAAAFPGEVADYHSIKRDLGILSRRRHRIYTLAPWQAEAADLGPVDMGFNQVSFEEMRTDTVAGYLSHLNRWRTRFICLGAVDKRIRDVGPAGDDYARYLPDYDLVTRVPVRRASLSRAPGEEGNTASTFYFRRKDG